VDNYRFTHHNFQSGYWRHDNAARSGFCRNGNNQTFTIAAGPGYTISNVIVDGVSQGAISSYTFYNVTVDHNIYATFYGTPVAGSTGNVTVPSGQTNYIIDASVVAQTKVTVNTTALPVEYNYFKLYR